MQFAHSTPDPDRRNWQPLSDHLTAVAVLARAFAASFGGGRAAELAGLLHDLGKYSAAFQAYLEGQGVSVDHSTAGAQCVRGLPFQKMDRVMADLLSFVIAGHHAGLADWLGANGGLRSRLDKRTEPLDEIWRREISPGDGPLVPEGFDWSRDKERSAFQLAFLGRMLFSCLVDADFLDTEAFYASVEGVEVDRSWPRLEDELGGLIARFDGFMAAKQAAAAASPVNRLRADILAHARAQAELSPGLFTLNVPTGGGKTLASLGFALDHARRHGLERIVYAIPFTSVIDQTAAVFREVLGDEVILEHHSAIEEEAPSRDELRWGRNKLRLAMENWAAPLVLTTNVQLFESLFAARTSRCRKLHNLARSVIILDEAQTIPLHVLRPCVAALDELARNYGATIVLCTATQPALAAPRFSGGLALDPARELAPDPAELHARLKRVRLEMAPEAMTDADLVGALKEVSQGLVIVNSRAHALMLYHEAVAAGLEGVVHLTTRQTAADRRRILADIRGRLDPDRPQPCRVIATSLVEAGVDLDFPRVWRAEAGLDQIMQAAGRCNREGRRPVDGSVVTVFRPAEMKPPREIAGFAAATARVLASGKSLDDPAAIQSYFEEVYWQKGPGLDREEILTEAFRVSQGSLVFSYRSAAEKFRMIESGMAAVIIPSDDTARSVLAALANGLPPAAAARKLQPHVVQVPPQQRQELLDNGHACFVEGFDDQFAVLKSDHLYTRETGLAWEQAGELGVENGIL